MRQKKVKNLRAQLISILGHGPTPNQWRAFKKRGEIVTEHRPVATIATIPNPGKVGRELARKRSWWRRLLDWIFIKRR